MDIPKLLFFIFGYFLFSAIIAPKQRIYPRRQTQLTYYRCALLYIYHRNDEPPGTAYVAIPGGSIGRLNRYNPFRPLSKQFHLCIGQYSNDRINFAFPTFQRCQFFRGWVPLTTSLVVPHLFYHFRQIFCRYFFGIFDLRGFCFVCHISNHLNN